MTEHYDDLETRAPEAREGALMARLPGLVAHAMSAAPGWARQLAGTDPKAVSSRKALAALPVLRKSELKALQEADPPFGGLTTVPPGRMGHLYMSPGPIFDPEGARDDPWRSARALWAAGIRAGARDPELLRLPPDAGRVDGGPGRAQAGLRGDPGGHRADGAADRGDPHAASGCLRGHAVLPAHHRGEGARDRRRHLQPEARAGRGRGAAAEPARLVPRAGHPHRAAVATAPPMSASSPTSRRRSRA